MGQLLCGAAKECITPPADWICDLRGLQDMTFHGVMDDIFVRVLLLDNGRDRLLFVSFDLDKVPVPQRMFDALREQFGIPEERVLLVSIHTHTAPIAGTRVNEGPNDISKKPEKVRRMTGQYETFLVECLVRAVTQAVDQRTPARLACGMGESCINVNRVQSYQVMAEDGSVTEQCGLGMDSAGSVDRSLFVMRVDREDGRPLAFLVNYPVHNCVMIQNPMISGDLGGAVSRLLEEYYGGSTALWCSGAAGDLNPLMCNEVFYPDPESGAPVRMPMEDGTFAEKLLKTLSAREFADIQRVIRRMGEASMRTSRVETSGLGEPEAAPELYGAIDYIELPSGNAGGSGTEPFGADPFCIRMHYLKVGRTAFFAVSGELYSSLGAVIRKMSTAEITVVVNHDASLLVPSGYIFDDETLLRDKDKKLPGSRACIMVPGTIVGALQASCERLQRGRLL